MTPLVHTTAAVTEHVRLARDTYRLRLTCPALAADEDGGWRRRHALDELVERPHRGARPGQRAERGLLDGDAAQRSVFVAEPAIREGTLHVDRHLVELTVKAGPASVVAHHLRQRLVPGDVVDLDDEQKRRADGRAAC